MIFIVAYVHPRQHSVQQCPLVGKAASSQNSARKRQKLLGNEQITRQCHKSSSIPEALKNQP